MQNAAFTRKSFFLMSLNTLLCLLLLLFRSYKSDFDGLASTDVGEMISLRGTSFLFLVWNLFLAWTPYFLALLINSLSTLKWPKLIVLFGVFIWLLFFPNAPYIITDLLHLKYRAPIPMWYDVLLIFSFAWTGVLLGFFSLFEIHSTLEKYFSKAFSWVLVLGCLALTGFGVFVGRFQRWNSWDIIQQPVALFQDMLSVLSAPLDHMRTFGLAIVLFSFLTIGYLTLFHLLSSKTITHVQQS